ncbi:Ig-like domain-containing protein [Nocardioides pelophilus]|uniref:Ig-like domain-containing protein n=1 Tax=Nocardioides pelophilus TaxID=2172019 RepID=UPI0016010221|nr:Ig-like domain-containing protein [Nocardioides pelophilus]
MYQRALKAGEVLAAALLLAGVGGSGAHADPPPNGSACTIIGTGGANILTGTSGADVICGLGGDDQINGLGGDDLLVGGLGKDSVSGGDGFDRILGGDGNDVLTGGTGPDEVLGQAGADSIQGQGGNDRLVGGAGNDVLRGGDGNDTLFGEAGDDDLHGDAHSDRTYGGDGNDEHFGGTGIDTLNDRDSAVFVDTLSCGDGDNELAYVDFPDVADPDCERERVLDRESPVAVDDVATVEEDATATTIAVLANDTDADGGPIRIIAVTQPADGTVVRSAGSVTYRPDANYCNDGSPPASRETFTYTLYPGGSAATVTVTVTCEDDLPVAVDDAVTVAEDGSATTIDVRANDTDVDADVTTPPSVASVTQPAGGTVTVTDGGAAVTYEPDAEYCNDGAPTDDFSYALTPGGASATVAVTVTCANDAPVVADLEGTSLSYFENGEAVVVTSTGTVSDVDSADFGGGSLQVDIPGGGQDYDELSIRDQGSGAGQIGVSSNIVSFGGVVIGTFSGGNGLVGLEITLDADATAAAVQALLRNITFRHVGDDPEAAKTVRFLLADGDGGIGDSVTRGVTIIRGNDAPAIVDVEETTLVWTEGDPAAVVTADGVVRDPDSPNFDGGSLTVSLPVGAEPDDRLEIVGAVGSTVDHQGTTVGFFTGGNGSTPLVITFNGNADDAAVQAVLRNVTFRHLGLDPGPSRTIRFVLADGDGGTSLPATRAVSVVPVNNAPVIASVETDPASYAIGSGYRFLTTTGTVLDADSSDFSNGSFTVTVVDGGQDADELTVRSQGQLTVNSNAIKDGPVTIGVFAGGGGSEPLEIFFVNAPTGPQVEGILRSIAYRHNGVAPTSSKTVQIVLTDGDGGTSTPATRTISITQ